MKKALFIVGPTAVGKTALAIKIHQKIPSVLISADSIQVYRGADIISGKDHPKNIEISFIDIFSPNDSYNVADFVRNARPLIEQISAEGKTPIIVGGTGLYIKSLFESINTINIPPNNKLREELNILSVDQLQEKFKKISPERFKNLNNSDVNNPRRLVRAIEISMTGQNNKNGNSVLDESEIVIIGLKTSSEDLRKRIENRVEQRISSGARQEAKELYKQYEQLSPQLKVANGYKQIFDFLQEKISWEEAVEKWETSDYQHAKAQMTYFKKMKVEWFDVNKIGFEQEILRLINDKLSL